MQSLKTPLLFTFLVFALPSGTSSANSKNDFCANALDTSRNLNYSWFQETRGLDPLFQIGFENNGGLIDEGVCWWHSEWTRNAMYQVVLAPELPKPTSAEASKIISKIMNSKSVVVMGGYSSLGEFTQDWQALLQKHLDERQLRTTFDFGWIRGLFGHSKENANRLESRMDALNEQVNTEHKIVFQMLQLPGVSAHAWLVLGMQATSDGYTLQLSDSNYPLQITQFDYVRGDTSEGLLYNQFKFIAYTQQDNKFSTYQNNIRNFCNQH